MPAYEDPSELQLYVLGDERERERGREGFASARPSGRPLRKEGRKERPC